jgi:hypothetical protein
MHPASAPTRGVSTTIRPELSYVGNAWPAHCGRRATESFAPASEPTPRGRRAMSTGLASPWHSPCPAAPTAHTSPRPRASCSSGSDGCHCGVPCKRAAARSRSTACGASAAAAAAAGVAAPAAAGSARPESPSTTSGYSQRRLARVVALRRKTSAGLGCRACSSGRPALASTIAAAVARRRRRADLRNVR